MSQHAEGFIVLAVALIGYCLGYWAIKHFKPAKEKDCILKTPCRQHRKWYQQRCQMYQQCRG